MTIDKIREELLCNKGKKVKLHVFGSRNKKEKFICYIDKIYENLFTVKAKQDDMIVTRSYSYIDVLTKTVKIEFPQNIS